MPHLCTQTESIHGSMLHGELQLRKKNGQQVSGRNRISKSSVMNTLMIRWMYWINCVVVLSCLRWLTDILLRRGEARLSPTRILCFLYPAAQALWMRHLALRPSILYPRERWHLFRWCCVRSGFLCGGFFSTFLRFFTIKSTYRAGFAKCLHGLVKLMRMFFCWHLSF